MGDSIKITSKGGKLAAILVNPDLLKISAVKSFADKAYKRSSYLREIRDQPEQDPSNYRVIIKVDDNKDLNKWVLQVVFKLTYSTYQKVVLERLLTFEDAKEISYYMQPFMPLLGHKRIEQLTEYLYSMIK